MDWLHSCYDSLECRTHKVMFNLPNEPLIVGEDGYLFLKVPMERFFSYLKTQKVIS